MLTSSFLHIAHLYIVGDRVQVRFSMYGFTSFHLFVFRCLDIAGLLRTTIRRHAHFGGLLGTRSVRIDDCDPEVF